jgi:hypothetical protein
MNLEELDGDYKVIIRNTALAVLKNGVTFLDWIKARRVGEDAYVFLFEGKGSHFFNWCLENPAEAALYKNASKHDVTNTSLSLTPPRHPRSRSPPTQNESRDLSSSRSVSPPSRRSYSRSSNSSRRDYRYRSRSRDSRRYRERSLPRHIRRRTPPREKYRREPERRREYEERREHNEDGRRRVGRMYAFSPSSEEDHEEFRRRR